jgi:hypothetical protein
MEECMANPYRGDVSFEYEGEMHALRLTLGALAHLEDALGADGLQTLGRRLGEGRMSARDICMVLSAGFMGSGKPVPAEVLGISIHASELERAAVAAATLLAVTFGEGKASRPSPPQAA